MSILERVAVQSYALGGVVFFIGCVTPFPVNFAIVPISLLVMRQILEIARREIEEVVRAHEEGGGW